MINFKQKNGITLIALIITIIVLLVLSAVVINLSFGNKGVIQKSQQASETYKKQFLKEEATLAIAELKMMFLEDTTKTEKNIEEYVQARERKTSHGTVYFEDTDYYFENDKGEIAKLIDSNGNLTVGEPVKNKIKLKIDGITLKVKDSTTLEANVMVNDSSGLTYAYELYEGDSKIGDTISSSNVKQEFIGLTAGNTYKVKVIITKNSREIDNIEEIITMPKIESVVITQIGQSGIHVVVTAQGLEQGIFTYKLYENGEELEAKRLTNVTGLEKDFSDAVIGRIYKVKVSARINNVEIASEIESNEITNEKYFVNVADYGRVVTNYSSTVSTTWRLFLQTEDYVYLMADCPTGNTTIPSNESFGTTESNIVSSINPMWINRADIASTKQTAWLVNQSRWKNSYKDSRYDNGTIQYIIGSPSIEQYIESWNASHKTGSNLMQLTCKISTKGYNMGVLRNADGTTNSDPYKVKPIISDSTGIYKHSSNIIIFSSPYNLSDTAMCAVYSDGTLECFNEPNKYNWFYECPVVCLSSSGYTPVFN